MQCIPRVFSDTDAKLQVLPHGLVATGNTNYCKQRYLEYTAASPQHELRKNSVDTSFYFMITNYAGVAVMHVTIA
jgi:hypothetical protein